MGTSESYSVSEELELSTEQTVTSIRDTVDGNGKFSTENVRFSQSDIGLPSASEDRAIHQTRDGSPTQILHPSNVKNESMIKFCTMKLDLLRGNSSPLNSTSEVTDSPRPAYLFQKACEKRLKNFEPSSNRKLSTDSSTYSICNPSRQYEHFHVTANYSTRQVEQIKLEVLYHQMAMQIKEIDEELKDTRLDVCRKCREQECRMAEERFVRFKLNLITKPSIERRLEEHLYQKDPLSLLGEVVSSSVRPSAPEEVVWHILKQKVDKMELGLN